MRENFELVSKQEDGEMLSSCPVIIIDAICGAGKTEMMIRHINKHAADKRFLFVTPFNKEIERIMKSCPGVGFKMGRTRHKVKDLVKAIENGENAICTHEAYKHLDESIIETLKLHRYTLIIDEVPDVIEPIKIGEYSLDTLKKDYIEVDEKGVVSWRKDKQDYSETPFGDIKQMCGLKKMMLFNDTVLLVTFPCEIFKAMEEVYVLTYMFPAQIQRYYFDYHKIPYEIKTITAGKLVNHDGKYHSNLKPFIHIYNGKLNDIGAERTALSMAWHKKQKNQKLIKNDLYNVARNIWKAKGAEVFWTTFSDYEAAERPTGFKKCFLAHNARATNDYKDRQHVIYSVNKFFNPSISNVFFKGLFGIEVNEELFALSEMLQFVFRSAIRDGKEVWLYVPSKRMRGLLVRFLNNEMECS